MFVLTEGDGDTNEAKTHSTAPVGRHRQQTGGDGQMGCERTVWYLYTPGREGTQARECGDARCGRAGGPTCWSAPGGAHPLVPHPGCRTGGAAPSVQPRVLIGRRTPSATAILALFAVRINCVTLWYVTARYVIRYTDGSLSTRGCSCRGRPCGALPRPC